MSTHSDSNQTDLSSRPKPCGALKQAPEPLCQSVYCFSILAESEAGVMPRVLELFAKRNLVPRRWVSDVAGPDNRELAIDLQVVGLTPEVCAYIARCLRTLHYVDRVLVSAKLVA